MDAMPRQTSVLAVLSLVFGILGWTLLPGLGAIVAVVTGHIARAEIRRAPQTLEGDGLAIAGLVMQMLVRNRFVEPSTTGTTESAALGFLVATVLVPAWQEAEVLPQSLAHLLTSARYQNFRVFVGVYPNDAATEAAARQVVRQDGRVIPVIICEPRP